MTGRVPVMFTPASTALPQVRSRALIALASTHAERMAMLPELPTMAEAGLPGFETGVWNGLLAPAGTPRPIIDRLSQAAATRRSRSEDVIKALDANGILPFGGTPEELGAIHPQRDRQMGQGGGRRRNAEADEGNHPCVLKAPAPMSRPTTSRSRSTPRSRSSGRLLVKGEPGTGKTVLALEIAKSLNAPLIEWHVKSTTKALQGLYEYDAVSRLRDSQLGDERVRDIRNYIKRGKLWDAFVAEERPVLLIDEIDKADIEFPNDLLLELDRMEFFVYETGETVKARRRPLVIITSNNEKELPDAFLRRCFFHYIRFPDADTMRAIIEVHFPGIKQRLVAEALKLFYEVREVPGLKKKPSTSELLDWLKLLMVEDIGPEILRERDPKKLIPPLHGALLKNEQDVHLFERLAFMARREGR